MRERSPQTLWETALGQLELQVTRPNFDTWLRHTQGIRLDGRRLVVGVPSDFALEWLRSRMSALINRTVSQLSGETLSVSFQVLGAAPLAPSGAAGNGLEQLLPSQAALNPKLTFGSFTPTKTSRVAYRAARKLAVGSVDYNPLVFVGPPGLGKTHLLHAIGHEQLAAGRRVVSLTAEQFVDGYVRGLRRGDPAPFRAMFDACQLLLLDDLQFLATRAASQEQFFHIFNTLQPAGCPIVLTTEIQPAEIGGLSDRLRSRIAAGLVIELSPPAREERLAILQAKAARLSPPLPAPMLSLIADQPYPNIRELEGALQRIDAYRELSSDPLTAAAAQSLLRPWQASPQPLSADHVLDAVVQYFHISRDHLTGPSRARDVTYARHIAMYLLRRLTPSPLTQIRRLLGSRDHSTVLSGCHRIEQELSSVPQTQTSVRDLQSILGADSAA